MNNGEAKGPINEQGTTRATPILDSECEPATSGSTAIQGNALSAEELIQLISEWAKKTRGAASIDANQTFEEAGFDSLDSVELAFFLESELGIDFEADALWNYPTPRAVADFLYQPSLSATLLGIPNSGRI